MLRNGNPISGYSSCLENLMGGERKSYRLRWKSPYRGKGLATLEYQIGWSDDFPAVAIELQTR